MSVVADSHDLIRVRGAPQNNLRDISLDIHVSVREVCEGRRFTDEVLGYRLRERNIREVLAMSVEEAQAFVVARSDWVIDLGPGAGPDGGRVMFSGSPADLVAQGGTLTAQHLAAHVEGGRQ